MTLFDRDAAADVIAELGLEPANHTLARHWLALWEGNALPRRAALQPARVKDFLPNLLLFDVVPEKSVTVRLAGTRYSHILGTELTGRDWIALAPEHHRPVRLNIFATVARGALLQDHRLLAMAVGDDLVCEEMLLPFAPDANGVQLVMAHVNLRVEQYLKIRSVEHALSDPLDYRLAPLPALAAVAA